MYVDVARIKNDIYVSERVDGNRKIKKFKPTYKFYHEVDYDTNTKSMYGHNVTHFKTTSKKKFEEKIAEYEDNDILTFEKDVRLEYRTLEEYYTHTDTPKLNVSVLDIEVDKDPELGYAPTDKPFNPLTGITIHNKWDDEYVTLIVPPKGRTVEDCKNELLVDDEEFGPLTEEDGYFIVNNEKELLLLTISMLEDSDVITGWNSEPYDIPYLINRIRVVLGGEKPDFTHEKSQRDIELSDESIEYLTRLNAFPTIPTIRMIKMYGSDVKTYTLHGKVSLDYLGLYRKFTFEELHSYSLDNILKREINQTKVDYEGDLGQLYRNDLKRFTAYSRQDVAGLSLMDDKLQMITLANTLAHMAGVNIVDTLGTVNLIEYAIMKELHGRNQVAPNKPEDSEKEYPIPGAFVLSPKKGIYKSISSYDYNSLYPNTIISLNISPETIFGMLDNTETITELRKYMDEGMSGADAWSNFAGTLEYQKVVNKSDDQVTLVAEDGERYDMTGRELNEVLYEEGMSITGFGVIMRNDIMGIVPHCLAKWYKLRKKLKASMIESYQKAEHATGDEKVKLLEDAKYYGIMEQSYKLVLNSSYGALLNKFFRFYDIRLGASTTMSGRINLQTMVSTIDEILSENNLDLS